MHCNFFKLLILLKWKFIFYSNAAHVIGGSFINVFEKQILSLWTNKSTTGTAVSEVHNLFFWGQNTCDMIWCSVK